jgi:hypothetical protein
MCQRGHTELRVAGGSLIAAHGNACHQPGDDDSMSRRCVICDGPAEVKGAGGVRACAEHVLAIADHRPLWMRLPDPDEEQMSLEALVACGALSPEGAEMTRELMSSLQQWATSGPDIDLEAMRRETEGSSGAAGLELLAELRDDPAAELPG